MKSNQSVNWSSTVRVMLRRLRSIRFFILLFAYSLMFGASFYLAYELRFDFNVPVEHQQDRLSIGLWFVGLKIILLYVAGQFSVMLTYFGFQDLYRIILSMALHGGFLVVMWFVFEGNGLPPRAVILVDIIMSLALLCAFRVSLRVARERFLSEGYPQKNLRRVAIVGTGDSAASLASDLIARRGLGMRPVAFLDTDVSRIGNYLHGLPVVDQPENLGSVKSRFGIDKVIIAMPSGSKEEIQSIVQVASRYHLPVEMVPSLYELASGKVRATQLRPVEFEDLLGRKPVDLDSSGISEMLKGKVVAVTGAGGSIGSELCRQVAMRNPERLILLEQAEGALFEIEQELIRAGFGEIIRPYVVDVLEVARVKQILERYEPAILFHAAAHKHVPLMENQPSEAIKNNTLATASLAHAVCEAGVQRFIFISTDKAINPTSVMGASKRLAEQCLQSIQKKGGHKTTFMAVRFGNVLGSSGSVIPIFKRQIAEGGPVTVTHPDVTRYFMTIPEAVGLVLQCSMQGGKGDIMVLDMGEPIKIIDVARQLIKMSDLEPDLDVEIKITGLRPGEKLYEELQHSGEAFAKTQHPRIYRFMANGIDAETVDVICKTFSEQWQERTPSDLKKDLKGLIPEYTPYMD